MTDNNKCLLRDQEPVGGREEEEEVEEGEDIAAIIDQVTSEDGPTVETLSASPVHAEPAADDDESNFGIVPWEHEPVLEEGDHGDSDVLQIPGWKKKAYLELQEKEEWRDRDIQALREMVLGVQSLHCPRDDAFLLRFLRAQKFDYDNSLSMLERYFLMRKTWKDNFAKALPSLSLTTFGRQLQTMLPHRDRLGRRVFLFRAGVWDPTSTSLTDIFAANYLMLEAVAREPKTQIAGLVVIVDMAGFGLHHVLNVTTEYVRSVAGIIQNTFPLRFREIHIINQSYFFHFVFSLIKPFLSETIRNRIQLHGINMSVIHENISPDILPVEFGGACGPMCNDDVVKRMLEKEIIFKDLRRYGFVGNVTEEDLDESLVTHPFQAYCMASSESS